MPQATSFPGFFLPVLMEREVGEGGGGGGGGEGEGEGKRGRETGRREELRMRLCL